MQVRELKYRSTFEECMVPIRFDTFQDQDVQLEGKSTVISTMTTSYSGAAFKANNVVSVTDILHYPVLGKQVAWKAQAEDTAPALWASTVYPNADDLQSYSAADDSNLQCRVYVGNATKLPQASISIKTIRSDIGTFVLAEPLEVTFEMDEDTYICWNEDFKLYGCGDSQREALRELESFFGDIYDSYRNTPKSELTEDARQLLENFNRRISAER